MAKHDWKALQEEFLREHAATGITAQEWCERRGLKYQSARRYIKPRAAQNAQENMRKSAQRSNSAQNCAKGDGSGANNNCDADNTNDNNGSDPQQDAKLNGRDKKGRFTEGNPGNPNAVSPFVPGHKYSQKHSAYAKYLDADELFEAVADSDLHDELIFTRARALSVTKTMKRIMEDLKNAESVEQRIELYDKLLKAEQGLDRNVARIESIERTLSSLALNAIQIPRLSEDTHRIKAATSKLKAETEKLTAESRDVTTPLSDVVSDIQGMNDNGMLSQ
ncbi:hypothetical protein PMPD1_2474 [Paramixta manurensis]|uniref:Terminase n=1 Tax=Paramixta manurensis TaxID=2740817 RepID=A0A6M8U9J6_9GAMM|nr:hypothetical protein PMPD1_2474 [Erwiniaceae bacterium PD-1]